MKSHILQLAAHLLVFSAMSASAATRYVNVNSASPAPPYTTWATAATTIQAAVDAAAAGDQILVTNGVYQTGGRVVFGAMTNRVAVNKPVTVQSVNGAAVTVIRGYQVPGTTNGDKAIRCVYLTNGAALVGFTVSNGATRSFGTPDILREQCGGGVWCESTSAVVSNCVLTANSARENGGGVYLGTLNNCALTGNSAGSGGGALGSTLSNCTLTSNSTRYQGGGVYGGVLNNCTLIDNSANVGADGAGGGAYSATLNNCKLTGNLAGLGGGTGSSTLNNCTLSGNSAGSGGGAWNATLNNCTLTGNSAMHSGGAAKYCALYNCIVYYNTTQNGANYSDSVLSYSCATPLPPGLGNISAEPQLVDLSHLSASSPCRGAGSAAYATGMDFDGETWADPPSIGCDEYYPSAVAGPLSVSIQAAYTNVAVGFTVNFTTAIDGRLTANQWEFGDGIVASNRPYASHSWAVAGDYSVLFRAHNDTYPDGVSATITVQVVAQLVHYVALSSTNAVAPYTNWATAAKNIQDAVDAVSAAGALVVVTNGVYQTGGRVVFGALKNRVAVNKPVTVQSVNGAAVTVIRGSQAPGTTGDSATRCVYLANGAAIDGFTLINGATRSYSLNDDYPHREQSGGGVWCESASAIVSNCTLTGNSATEEGGGAFGGTLNNCMVTGNSARSGGGAARAMLNHCTLMGNSDGGAYDCTLISCTISGNSAQDGGGASGGTLNNCTLTGNSASWRGGGAYNSTLNNCTLSGNSAGISGGGAYIEGSAGNGTLNNCTLSGNWAGREGGGASGGTLNNCIVYDNTALLSGDNYSSDISFSHSCTTPLPPSGVGNISAEPQLVGLSHVSVGSPCRGAGSTAYSTGLDIDGESWADPPSMGCDEFHPGAVTGPLSVNIQAAYTSVITGLALNFTASIDGRVAASRWEFNDGTAVSNQPYTSHSWTMAGDYPVVLQAYNETYPGGISSTVTVHVVAQPVHYVALASPHPAAPYTSWATAANNIQDAIDAAFVAGALVLVTNGVYQTGGRAVPELSRVAVTKPLVLQSVNGASVTMIQGSQVMRCVYLTNGAALVGFTLTSGFAQYGGGVRCESHSAVVSDCVLTANSVGMDGHGGGAFGGTLNNCTLRDNSISQVGYGGGGASFSTLNNCTLTGNSATYGGGASDSTLNHCTLTGNSAYDGGGVESSTLNDCTLSGNFAGGGGGGGADQCTLNNCTLSGNSARGGDGASYWGGGGVSYSTLNNCVLIGNAADGQYGGGGAYYSKLNSCTVTGNSASGPGGGAFGGTLNNCIVYSNSAQNGANYSDSVLSYSCTTPLPTNGLGNFSKAPLFVDYTGGNLRLQSNSPCINSGSNALAPAGPDLAGNPRITGGTVDIGAYEFQSPQSAISYAWLQQYNLPTDGSADNTDTDADGLGNWQEWRVGTNPTNALSVLRLLSPASGESGLIVSWQSVTGLNYVLERATRLGAQPLFLPLATNIVGQPGTTTFTDTNAVGAGPFFYRVGVQE